MSTDLVKLARAADYAARQHIAQRRKGEQAEPYVNHLIEVAALLAEATAGEDVVLLMGGLLHDLTGGYRVGLVVAVAFVALASTPFWTVPALRHFR